MVSADSVAMMATMRADGEALPVAEPGLAGDGGGDGGGMGCNPHGGGV